MTTGMMHFLEEIHTRLKSEAGEGSHTSLRITAQPPQNGRG